jgi:hypothetical protein
MQFSQLAAQRPADANRIVEPDLTAAEIQEKAYPDLRPMELERSATETFDIVHEAVKRIGWTIVLNEPPGEQPGRIEATDRTMIMGYTDDVLVRQWGRHAPSSTSARCRATACTISAPTPTASAPFLPR